MRNPSKRKLTGSLSTSKSRVRTDKKPARKPLRAARKSKDVPKMSLSSSGRVLLVGKQSAQLRVLADGFAAELNSELVRIDLSEVTNKYIGETEKNLERVFDAAEASGAVLFFDEADALFGRRTGVQSGHDRYANLEVSYLLQRIEEYSGTVILASNRKSQLDKAFLARLGFST